VLLDVGPEALECLGARDLGRAHDSCSAGDTGFGRVMPVALFFFGAAAGAAGDLDEAAAARTTTAEAERRGGAKEAVGRVEPCRGTGSEKESDATVSMGTAAIWTRLCGWSLGLVRIMARVFFLLSPIHS
jgi:hypothetical protein